MFASRKMFDRDHAARTVKIVARRTCIYRNAREPMARVRCDCKYGIAEHPDDRVGSSGEQNGCPELNMLLDIIETIPKREWERIVKRAAKKRRWVV